MNPAILPGSLWDLAIVHQQVVLNILGGSQMRIAVRDLGHETVPVGGRNIPARHCKITGDLERDLWLDARSALARVQFAGKDGSSIVDELK